MDRTRTALREMARDDPELAARLVLQTLPAAAARIRGPLRYELAVGDMGTWLVVVDDDGARVEPGSDGEVDFVLSTNAEGLARLAAGASPLRLMLGGTVRIRGKRRRAMRLRAMSSANGLSMADALAGGAQLDPDAVYRSLAYMIDPEWTRGHSFAIAYELSGEGGGRWYVHVDDGARVRVTTDPPERDVAATTRVSVETFKRLVSGEVTPAQSMREQLAEIDGEIYPTVLVGRWIERAQGRDDAELAREARQRGIQARRAASWGASANGDRPTRADSAPPPSGDPPTYGDLRGRMLELEKLMLPPWFDTFDNGLRDVANRIEARPDDLDLFVEGIATYHLVIEGVLATTGQRMILKYTEDHGLYPGFQKGFSLVEQDEHRHIAFGVRFLRDVVADDPGRHGATIERTVAELVPRAAHVFVPEYADSPRDFVSYGYHSSFIYGYAYRKLKRRMGVLGLDCPPPVELMPGPIASAEEARDAGMPV